MTCTNTNTSTRARSRPAHGLIPTLLNLLALSRQRRRLASLDADRLADLGISQQAAQTEANRPIWDVPANWRQ